MSTQPTNKTIDNNQMKNNTQSKQVNKNKIIISCLGLAYTKKILMDFFYRSCENFILLIRIYPTNGNKETFYIRRGVTKKNTRLFNGVKNTSNLGW